MDLNASSHSFDQRVNLVEKIIANMKGKAQATGKSGILLAGDPGVGKTSFIRFFSQLTGIEQITIEAPHITEEHIINIPFIVHDPVTQSDKPGVSSFNTSDFKVVLSDSNLYSKLNSVKKINDKDYLKYIYRSAADVIKIFEELGGDEKTIPEILAEVRKDFRVILFLDEYFRQTSPKIRNMLRGILNNKIGSHDIPHDIFIIYASNINDEGVEGIPKNNDFHEIEFGAPNKDDWFSWLIAKFEKDEKIKLNKNIVEKFYKLISEEELNNKDINDIRTSPRRWEQILLYINSSLPVKNEKEAKGLLTNIKTNFRDYQTGAHSELAGKVLHAVAELIKETSDIDVSESDTNSPEDWKDTLEHQIQQKMKQGAHRKYIPIISGEPGIGKTTHAIKIAKDLDLRYIYIDCSNLNPEDVVGLPLPTSNSKQKIETQFSEPNLFHQINKDMEEADADHIEYLKHTLKGNEAKQAIKEYKDKHWKYLIFFDELNRNSTKVFNGIRRLLLEKSFGGGYDLPEGAVIMAAINPSDNGAEQLTDHMKDVVDIIDAKADFSNTKKFLENMPFATLKFPAVKDVVYDALMKFVDKFAAKPSTSNVSNKQRFFYLDIGASPVYISPREYSDLYSNAVIDLDQKVARYLKKTASEPDDEKIAATEKKLRESLYDSFAYKLNNIMTKQDSKSPEFMANLKTWFLHSSEIDFGNGLYYNKAKTAGLQEILDPFFNDPNDTDHLANDYDFKSYVKNIDPHKFKEDLIEFFTKKYDTDEDNYVREVETKFKGKKVSDKGDIEFTNEEVSKFEHLIREIVNAIQIHKLSNDFLSVIKDAALSAFQLLLTNNTDHLDELLDVNMAITNFVDGDM